VCLADADVRAVVEGLAPGSPAARWSSTASTVSADTARWAAEFLAGAVCASSMRR
jgi:hypothetical protein